MSDGAPDPVTDVVRAADLRARAPQSAIPTQGGSPLLPPPRSGPPPMGPMIGPPSGPARRSPLVTPQGRPTPQHPSGEQPPVDEVSVPLKVRLSAQWRHAREVAKTPPGRWTLIGLAAVLQVFLLFSTVMWWAAGPGSITASSAAPMTWTGIVYDVGAAGVNLRSATVIDPANAADTAARGSRLAVQCGQTGDVVQKGNVNTATWLKTTDGLFVSMLYVRVPDRQSIPSCTDSTVDAPLLALADPANPDLPPPPNGLEDASGSSGSGTIGGATRSRVAAAAGQGAVAARVPASAAPVGPGAPAMPPARASAPTTAQPPIGSGSGAATPTSAPSDSGGDGGGGGGGGDGGYGGGPFGDFFPAG
ncbi:hypothetical protein [Actinomycetospora atypica]|uniref:Uncharacterized protein n=1 Tax=Actinomycetospora atypica TaxID=1290095 RepID=A0ABV9YFJ8_9PSEU